MTLLPLPLGDALYGWGMETDEGAGVGSRGAGGPIGAPGGGGG